MSQLEHDTSDEVAFSHGIRPEEDPWSSLAVAEDEADASDRAVNDRAIPSPALGGYDAEEDADVDATPDGIGMNADSGIAVLSPSVTGTTDDVAVPSPDIAIAPRAARRLGLGHDDWERAAAAAESARVLARAHAVAEPELAGLAGVGGEEGDADQTILTMVDPAVEPTRGGAFTIPMLCAGIAIIACCVLIPQADANRRLAYERLKLQADLEAVQRQVAVNDDFLAKVSEDPNLAERLAQRQMKIIRAGTKVLALKGDDEAEMSPFQLTAIAPPPPLPDYRPRSGTLAAICYNPKTRLYLMGTGLLLTAVGLVLGLGPRSPE